MLKIAFDRNINNEFLNQERPLVVIENNAPETFHDYCVISDEILDKYKNEPIIIIKNNSDKCSSNMLAVALFVSSALSETQTECIVFKVLDYEDAIAKYKPYVALTIALKYAIRLYNLTAKEIYREISTMSYLGICVKRNYFDNSILLNYKTNLSKPNIVCNNIQQAIIYAATLKTYSLLEIENGFFVEIKISEEKDNSDIYAIINQVIQNVINDI